MNTRSLPLIGISTATFSLCRTWRYVLRRTWNLDKPVCMFIGLNPSTADETVNDPTVVRCIKYAQAWKYGSLYMLNLFALRSTDPKLLYTTNDPIGPENDIWLTKIAILSQIIVAAWGNHGKLLNRSKLVLEKMPIDKLHVLGITNQLEPAHPLYLRSELKPILYQQARSPN